MKQHTDGKPRIGQNGAQLLSIGITFPKIPNFFIEACLWAIFVSHGVQVDRAMVIAQEASSCIAPFRECRYGSIQDAIHELILRNIFELKRVVCCTTAPQAQSAPFDSLANVVSSIKRRCVHVYIHDSTTANILILNEDSTCVMLCIHQTSKTVFSFETTGGAADKIKQSSNDPWVYICALRV